MRIVWTDPRNIISHWVGLHRNGAGQRVLDLGPLSVYFGS
jgi:hypothetical protein